jgi:hypothetical protein
VGGFSLIWPEKGASGPLRVAADRRRGLIVAEVRPEPVFQVGFDEDALAEDLERLPASAEIALREFRKELGCQGGIPKSKLRACQAEGRDGTSLGGCVKTYIP